MTTSTIIVLVLCCVVVPMGAFVTMNSKKKNNDDNSNNKNEASSSTLRRMSIVYLLLVLVGIACFAKILYLSIVERGLASGDPDKCFDTTDSNYKKNPIDSVAYCYIRENSLIPNSGY